ncbi:MAG: substrate-binding domain-containing protein [Thiolinea sp.]
MQSGYLVAKTLVEQARAKQLYARSGDGKTIEVVGVNGANRSFTTIQRERGLEKYAAENPDVKINQVVKAYWEPERARDAANMLLNLYPESSIIWSASDLMSIGAAEGAEQQQRKPGQDVLTCGVDWINEIFPQIERGYISCSVGGHVFDGAWLMVLLMDHFNGQTDAFIEEKTRFSVVNAENMNQFKALMQPEYWERIDFRQFSQAYGHERPESLGFHLLIENARE